MLRRTDGDGLSGRTCHAATGCPWRKAHVPGQIVGKFEILRSLHNLRKFLTIRAWTQSETPLRPAPAPRRRNSQVAMTFEKRFALL